MKVLISPGYGAGWSTWNDKEMAVDKDLIALFEKGCTCEEMEQACIEKGYDHYMGGFEDLEITEVPEGVLFQVDEYDGHEFIKIFYTDEWTRAEE